MVRAIVSPKAAQHKNPVPNAAVHCGLMVSSGILGKELDADGYPEDVGRQIDLAFQYLIDILDAAGATTQDVIKLDLYFADKGDRPLANSHWNRIWPDAEHRPARQAHLANLTDGCLFQIVATAVLGPAAP